MLHRMKGWSAQERAHAQKVFDRAESGKHPHMRMHEHAHLVLAVVMTSLLAAGVVILLLPLLLLGDLAITIPSFLLLGIIAGLLYCHSYERHALGFGVLLLASFLIMLITMQLFSLEGTLLAFAYSIGMAAAYLERRYHTSGGLYGSA